MSKCLSFDGSANKIGLNPKNKNKIPNIMGIRRGGQTSPYHTSPTPKWHLSRDDKPHVHGIYVTSLLLLLRLSFFLFFLFFFKYIFYLIFSPPAHNLESFELCGYTQNTIIFFSFFSLFFPFLLGVFLVISFFFFFHTC